MLESSFLYNSNPYHIASTQNEKIWKCNHCFHSEAKTHIQQVPQQKSPHYSRELMLDGFSLICNMYWLEFEPVDSVNYPDGCGYRNPGLVETQRDPRQMILPVRLKPPPNATKNRFPCPLRFLFSILLTFFWLLGAFYFSILFNKFYLYSHSLIHQIAIFSIFFKLCILIIISFVYFTLWKN